MRPSKHHLQKRKSLCSVKNLIISTSGFWRTGGENGIAKMFSIIMNRILNIIMYSKCCMRQTIIHPPPICHCSFHITAKGRNGQILEVKVPRTYIISWKALSKGNYPALTHGWRKKIILPFFFLFILNDHPLGVFFSGNVLVKKTIVWKGIWLGLLGGRRC